MSRRSCLLNPFCIVCLASLTYFASFALAPRSAEAGFGVLFPRHHAPVAAYRPVVAPVAVPAPVVAPVVKAARVPYRVARPVVPVAPVVRRAPIARPYRAARLGYSPTYAVPAVAPVTYWGW